MFDKNIHLGLILLKIILKIRFWIFLEIAYVLLYIAYGIFDKLLFLGLVEENNIVVKELKNNYFEKLLKH